MEYSKSRPRTCFKSISGIKIGSSLFFFIDSELSWPHEFGHGMAKSSYGAWERESVISSWMIHQEETGIDREIGKPKRRAEHATKRSVVECEDRSVGFPISARQRVHAA